MLLSSLVLTSLPQKLCLKQSHRCKWVLGVWLFDDTLASLCSPHACAVTSPHACVAVTLKTPQFGAI